jgi:hypothetical protein
VVSIRACGALGPSSKPLVPGGELRKGISAMALLFFLITSRYRFADSFISFVCNQLVVIIMDKKDIESMVKELDKITRELDETQKEITRDIAEKISSIQRLMESVPPGEPGHSQPREVVMEKGFARITVRDNGQTLFDGLF